MNQSDATEKKFKKKLSGQQTGIIANDCGNFCIVFWKTLKAHKRTQIQDVIVNRQQKETGHNVYRRKHRIE